MAQERYLRRRYGGTEPASYTVSAAPETNTLPVQQRTYTPEELKRAGSGLQTQEKILGSLTRKIQLVESAIRQREKEGKPDAGTYRREELQRLQAAYNDAANEYSSTQARLGNQYTAARQAAPKDYRSGEFIGQGRDEQRAIRETLAESRRTPGIYEVPGGGRVITTYGRGDYTRNGKSFSVTPGVVVRRPSSSPLPNAPPRPSVPFGPQVRTPTGQSVPSVTAQNINFIASGQTPTYTRQEEDFISRIEQVQAREATAAQRSTQARDIFRVIPGLRGDNYVQRFTRQTLALPGTVGFEIGATVSSSVERALLSREAYRLNPSQTKKTLRSAAKETPGSVVSIVDPRQPEGLVNLGLLAAGGASAARGFRTPVKTTPPKIITGRSVTGARGTTTTLRYTSQQQGFFNFLARRGPTRTTTTILPSGRVTTIQQTSPLLGQSTRIRTSVPGGSTQGIQTITRAGRTTTRSLRVRPSSTALVFNPLGSDVTSSRAFQQSSRPGTLAQTATRAQQGRVSAVVQGRPFEGYYTRISREQRLTSLEPSSLFVGETTSTGLTADVARFDVQRRLAIGRRRTSLTNSANLAPELDLDMSLQQGRGVAVTRQARIETRPPITDITRSQKLAFQLEPVSFGERVQRLGQSSRGLFPRGRRGTTSTELERPFQEIIQRFKERPVTIRRLGPPGFGNTPVIRIGGLSGSRAFLGAGVASISSQRNSFFPATSPVNLQRQNQFLAQQPSARYQFDVNIRQQTAPQQRQESFFQQRTIFSPASSGNPFSGATSFSFPGFANAPRATPGFLPTFGGGDVSGGVLPGTSGVRRKSRYAPDLFSQFFNIRAKSKSQRARLRRQGSSGSFTGFEVRPQL